MENTVYKNPNIGHMGTAYVHLATWADGHMGIWDPLCWSPNKDSSVYDA